MDSAAQEENSSSQNVRTSQTTVQRIKEGSEGYECVLSGGTSFFILFSDFKSLTLQPGMPVHETLIEALESYTNKYNAWNQAIRFLAFRDHSCVELALKLRQKRYEEPAISEICALLMEKGYLDDELFCEKFISSQKRKGKYSITVIRQKLQQKGVSRDIIDQSCAILLDSEYENAALDKAFSKLKKDLPDEKKIASLMRKGFSYQDIRRKLE